MLDKVESIYLGPLHAQRQEYLASVNNLVVNSSVSISFSFHGIWMKILLIVIIIIHRQWC